MEILDVNSLKHLLENDIVIRGYFYPGDQKQPAYAEVCVAVLEMVGGIPYPERRVVLLKYWRNLAEVAFTPEVHLRVSIDEHPFTPNDATLQELTKRIGWDKATSFVWCAGCVSIEAPDFIVNPSEPHVLQVLTAMHATFGTALLHSYPTRSMPEMILEKVYPKLGGWLAKNNRLLESTLGLAVRTPKSK